MPLKPSTSRIATTYPDHITLSPVAEHYLDNLGSDLILGRVELPALPASIFQIYVFAHSAGCASRQPEIDRANADADRLYRLAFDPRPPIKVGKSYAEIQRTRAAIYGKDAR